MEWSSIDAQIKDDADYSIGRISPWYVIGFALRMLWPFLAISGEYAFANTLVSENAPLLNLVSFISFACTMLVYGIFFKHLRKLFSLPKRRDIIRLIAAFSIALGVVIIVIANIYANIAFAALIFAGILTGFGSAILMMSYGVSASACDVASIALSAAASFALAIIAFALIILVCHASACVCSILSIIIPFCEWVCLHQSSKHFIDKLEFSSMTIPVRTVPFALHIALPALLFGIALAICRLFMVDILKDNNIDAAPILIISALISAIFIVIAVFTQRHVHNFITRVLIPIITAVLAITVVFHLYNTTQYLLIFTCSYILIAASVWITLSNIAQRYRISAFTVYGFGYGSLLVGEVIVFSFTYSSEHGIHFADSFSAIAILLLALISIATTLLPREEELKKTLKLNTTSNERARVYAQQAQINAQISKMQANIEQARTNETQANMDNSQLDMDEQQNVDKQLVNVGEHHAGFENTLTDKASKLDKHNKKSTCSIEMLEEVQQKMDDADKEQQIANAQDEFKRKCAVIADTYLLSRREAEVLLLLARGRNAAAIQNILYIAPGTANTHMRHIYRKINVHSQQELIELVENVELDSI